MFAADPEYGYRYAPGIFDVTLNEAMTYRLSIDSATRARVNPFATRNDSASMPEIHLFGCSFFAGFGVSDSDVVSAQLQLLVNPHNKVVNYSIPGHGMTTQLRLLRQSIERGQAPAIAVFSIASFHLHRNPATYSFIYFLYD